MAKNDVEKTAGATGGNIPIQETPEFQAAVRDAVRDAIPDLTRKILSELQAAGVAANTSAPGTDRDFAESLAVAIAGLTDQSKQVVPPAVLRQRAEARDAMMKRIVEARQKGQVPVYELRDKVYLEEQVVDPIFIDPASKKQCATQIEWLLVPNDAMIPVNEVASEIHDLFMASNGNVEKDNFERPLMGVTAGGLVVRSGSAALRPAQALRSDDVAAAPNATNEGGMNVLHKARPGQYVEKRVLGTVAAPARQTV